MLNTLIRLIVLVSLVSCASIEPTSIEKISNLEGVWSVVWDNRENMCREDRRAIQFSPDGSSMSITHDSQGTAGEFDIRKTFEYKIIRITKEYIRMELEGETRRDSSGKKVVWDLVPKNANAFCWRRTDWGKNDCTEHRYRCRS